ncbi:MAG: carbamoyl-phosphate synthase (small chain) protein [Pseudomonadota bacterium]
MQLTELLAAAGSDAAGNLATASHSTPVAVLALADGTIFQGYSIGAQGSTVGEVVFNTSMTGYQEILTDPSYCRQIVTLTYPHIGNTGWNEEDDESIGIQAAGLVIRDLSAVVSNFRSQTSLSDALRRAGVVAIAGVDTRALTRRLRDTGAQSACILAASPKDADTSEMVAQALKKARDFPGLEGLDLAKVVSTNKAYPWTSGPWRLGQGHADRPAQGPHVVAFDYGVKRNILRLLVERGCKLTVVPAQTSFEEAMALKPHGLFLSNGPGDPAPCDYAIEVAREAMKAKVPLFGICLGHQILALAAGAKTFKMKFGHHGANHPVQDLRSGRVFITSQNHGFAVDPKSLPTHLEVSHVSLFDGSIQGLRHTQAPAFCFQGHPEASPGPHDILPLFDQFFDAMRSSNA